MDKNKDNVAKVEFGTTQPNTKEVDEQKEREEQEYRYTCFVIGQSTLEWAVLGKRDEYITHMLELYDHFHKEDEQQETTKPKIIEVPKKEIILPK